VRNERTRSLLRESGSGQQKNQYAMHHGIVAGLREACPRSDT
jgi:hypothetical protein